MNSSYDLAAKLSTGGIVGVILAMNLVVLVIFGGIFWWLRWQRGVTSRRLAGAEQVTTIGRLSDPVRAGGEVPVRSITGIVGAPNGRVTAPVTNRDCAWYRVQLFQRKDTIDPQAAVRTQLVNDVSSAWDVVVRDDTGSAVFTVDEAGLQSDWLADSRKAGRRPAPGELFLHGERTPMTIGFEQREYVLPVRASVTIIGRIAVLDGRLVRVGGDPLVMTAKAPQEAAAAHRTALQTGRRLEFKLAGIIAGTLALINAMVVVTLAGA